MTVPVYLIALGPAAASQSRKPHGVLLQALARRLNRVQEAFDFRLLPQADSTGAVLGLSLEEVESCDVPPYYTDGSILRSVEKFLHRYPEIDPDTHVVVVTNVRVTKGVDCSPAAKDGEDYFGLWAPEGVDRTRRRGVISTALYLDRYQEKARRTAEQYVAYMLMAYLGDTSFDPRLTHRDFRFCVFDYNDDLDSIVPSIRRSGLCEGCDRRIGGGRSELADLSPKAFREAYLAILRYVHRPHPRVILDTLQSTAVFSLTVLVLAAGVSINLLSDGLNELGVENRLLLASGAFLVLVLIGSLWVAKEHFIPGRLFR